MQRHLITSAIPYINGVKHLGNLIGSQLPADLYARYQRARGNEVLFLCATDEHGTPAELAAAKANQDISEYCEEMHAVQAQLADGFRLSFDHFGRSSSQENHKLTQHFAGQLEAAGLIKEVIETQIYSHVDRRYLPDRYIEGTCPACGFEDARGDQCDSCTKQLDPTDLINPRSSISGATELEQRETKHLYLCQSNMRDNLENWIESKTDWPVLTTSIAKKWLHDGDGLQDRGITRDLDWGIPVKKGNSPWPGMEDKVFYVWFDAPIEYIACAQEWVNAGKGNDWEKWWRTDKGADEVVYTQFMGKDNVPFHTLSFPATILGSGEPWKLVDYIKSLAFAEFKVGNMVSSIDLYNRALEIDPTDYKISLDYSFIYYESGDIEKAIKIIKDSIEEVPGESLLYYRLVIYLMDSGRYKESINVLESALSLNFDNHEVLFDFVPNFETQSALIRVINQYRKNELQ